MKKGRPVIYTTELIEQIRLKFEDYIENEDIPIVVEFAYKNNITRQRLYELAEQNVAFSDTMKKCLEKKEANLEKFALLNIMNPTMAIFSLKQIGWRDKQQVEHSGDLGVQITVEEKYD